MAETFTRAPTPGGDLDAWAAFNDGQNLRTLGLNTCYLYNDSGTLRISAGQMGIDNGSVKGTINITAAKAISLVGLTASRWAKVELSVSGSSVTIEITSIAAANDPKTLPTDFTSGYDGTKGAFHITASKRCAGLVWLNASGVLEGIINVLSGKNYYGYSQSDDANDIKYSFFESGVKSSIDAFIDLSKIEYVNSAGARSTKKAHTKIIEIGNWNMDSTAFVSINHGLAATSIIKNIEVWIYPDAGAILGNAYHLETTYGDAFCGYIYVTPTQIILTRTTGALFDSAVYFASGAFNRGIIVIDYIE